MNVSSTIFYPNKYLTRLKPLLNHGKTAVTDPKNYRLIASVSVFSKVLEYIFLDKFSHLLHTSYLQFGYKKDVSTNHAALSVKEIINHYTSRTSPIFACFLDASKAFDGVSFDELAFVLLGRNVPPRFVSILITMYSNQVAHVD